jgi:glycosyltransferase involved in cell wall biosynthesis
LLSYLEGLHKLTFVEGSLHFRSRGIYSSIKSIASIFKISEDFEPDLILLEGPGFLSFVSLILKTIYELPLMVRVKGDLWKTYAEINHDLPLYEKVTKLLNYKAGTLILKHADAILPISEHIGKVTTVNLSMDKPMHVVYIPFFNAEDNTTNNGAQPPGLDSIVNGNYVLTVTNFNFWAKVHPLLHAIKTTAPVLQELGIKWLILGDGFFFEKFKQSIMESISMESVLLLGRQNPYSFYKKAMALFYISGMDGLPNVLLEASHSRLPIIMNKECDSVEFVVNGYNGIIADFNDRSQITEIINKINTDQEFRNTIGDNAYSYLQANFSLKHVSSQLEEAINSTLATSGD